MKKRILLVVLALCVVFAAVACAPMSDAQVQEVLQKSADEINKENPGTKVTLDLEGDKIYYRMAVDGVDSSQVDDAMKERLESMLTDPQMKESLEVGFKLIRTGINRNDMPIVLELCTSDGEVIVSQEY